MTPLRRAAVNAALLALAGCAATPIPPEETPYFREQSAAAHAARPAAAGDEAQVLAHAARALETRAAEAAAAVADDDEAAGLLDLDAPGARAFVAALERQEDAEAALAAEPLPLERVLLAVFARSPDVAAARARRRSVIASFDQATYLEDLLLRYDAFARLASPVVGGGRMRGSAFPYPGLVALKGEMLDSEVTMAREDARMRVRDVLAAAAMAFHDLAHATDELRIREEQLAVDERVLAATRARVETGRAPQAELLEMEAERAVAANAVADSLAKAARARGVLNTYLRRDVGAPLRLAPTADPPAAAPPVEPLLAALAETSPEVRMARAAERRTAAAVRMGEVMLFAAPAPGAVGGDTMRDGAVPGAPPAFGPDVAWIDELRERRAALAHAAGEALLRARRDVLGAQLARDTACRAFALAEQSSAPLSRDALEERIRLYEAGRSGFAELGAAIGRHLDAEDAAAAARHDYGRAEAAVWMAAGARTGAGAAAEESQR